MKKLPVSYVKRRPGESARQAVLRVLKLHGESTAAQLAKVLKITYTGVRRHLLLLQQEGLILASSQQQGAGRPVYKYCLSETAGSQFPDGYENMALGMLDTVFKENGHTGIMDLLRLNNNRLAANLQARFINKTLRERVEELARYFAGEGYMTDYKTLPDGNFFLYHQNCAIYKLAIRYRQLCILEPRLMECLLGVKVTRQQYILKDQPICGYFIDAKRPLC